MLEGCSFWIWRLSDSMVINYTINGNAMSFWHLSFFFWLSSFKNFILFCKRCSQWLDNDYFLRFANLSRLLQNIFICMTIQVTAVCYSYMQRYTNNTNKSKTIYIYQSLASGCVMYYCVYLVQFIFICQLTQQYTAYAYFI